MSRNNFFDLQLTRGIHDMLEMEEEDLIENFFEPEQHGMDEQGVEPTGIVWSDTYATMKKLKNYLVTFSD